VLFLSLSFALLGIYFSRFVACVVGLYIGGVGATARVWGLRLTQLRVGPVVPILAYARGMGARKRA
jgi:hypothetical protein